MAEIELSNNKQKLEKLPKYRKYNSSTNALEVVESVDLNGRTMLVTGSNSGIGVETVRTLALKGAHVVMANRNTEESAKVRDDILAEKPDVKIDLLHIDLSSLKSVKVAAEEFLLKGWPLHVLILNAGVFSPSEKTTADGYETAFGVNHLGHFYLTYLLIDKLRECAPSRIVIVASITHNHSGLNPTMPIEEKIQRLTNPSLSQMSYRLYACSKLCNILTALKLHRNEFGNGIMVYAVHPGSLIFTGISRTFGWPARLFYLLARPLCKTLQQGAATTVYCAASDDVLESSGKYFEDCWDDERSLAKSLVHDEALQDALWNCSVEMTQKFEQSQSSKQ